MSLFTIKFTLKKDLDHLVINSVLEQGSDQSKVVNTVPVLADTRHTGRYRFFYFLFIYLFLSFVIFEFLLGQNDNLLALTY